MKTPAVFFTIFLFSFLSYFSCASAPPKTKNGTVPEWVLNVPQSTAFFEYFTASGAGENPAQAEKEAETNLLLDIMRRLGVFVKTNSSALSFGSINNLDKFIEKEITENASAQIKNLKIKSRHIEKSGGITTVYLLAEYDKKELEKEQARLLKAAKERTDKVNIPHKNGDRLFAEKRYFKAFELYVQAACAALEFGVPDAELKFKENIEAANYSLKNVMLNAVSEAHLVQKADSPPVFAKIQTEPELPLTVTYSVQSAKGKRSSKKVFTEKITADKNGFAEFAVPAQTGSGNGFIIFEADVSGLRERLSALGNTAAHEVSDPAHLVHRSRVSFTYAAETEGFQTAGTKAPETKGSGHKPETVGVFLEEYAGTAFGMHKQEAAAFFAETLKTLNFEAEILKTKNAAARFVLSAKIKTENMEKNDSGFFVKLIAEIRVYDSAKGITVYSKKLSKRGAGFSPEKAEQSALRAVIQQAADNIHPAAP